MIQISMFQTKKPKTASVFVPKGPTFSDLEKLNLFEN